MTTTLSTVVNFSIKDIIERIGRIRVINNITEELKDTVVFPREKTVGSKEDVNVNFSDFTNDYIGQTVEKALNDVCNNMQELGVTLETGSWNNILIKPTENVEDDDIDYLFAENEDQPNELENEMLNNLNFENTDSDSDLDQNINRSVGGSDLKDYSNKVKEDELAENSQYIKINLDHEKTAVVKKTTYCWMLDEKRERVSTDRLRRFMTPKRGKSKKKCLKKRKLETSSSSSDGEKMDSEDFLDDETEDEIGDETNDHGIETNNLVSLKAEQYYAVFYEERWYIGRIVEETENEHFKIQFLQEDLELYRWPKIPDIAIVNKKFIFYGPINLIGNGPFQINRHDSLMIAKSYKLFKKRF